MRRDGEVTLAQAETQLIARLYPRLRAFAAVVAPAGEDPNDLVQEALVRVLRGGSLTRLEYPQAYLRTTIYHLAIASRRQWIAEHRALVRVEADIDPPQFSWQLEELMHLTPKARAVMYLRIVERMPHAEIALLLGCSEDSVRKTASRAKRRLRRLLSEEVNDATA